eukprot:g29340.t1
MQAHDARNLLQYLESDKANQNYSEEERRSDWFSNFVRSLRLLVASVSPKGVRPYLMLGIGDLPTTNDQAQVGDISSKHFLDHCCKSSTPLMAAVPVNCLLTRKMNTSSWNKWRQAAHQVNSSFGEETRLFWAVVSLWPTVCPKMRASWWQNFDSCAAQLETGTYHLSHQDPERNAWFAERGFVSPSSNDKAKSLPPSLQSPRVYIKRLGEDSGEEAEAAIAAYAEDSMKPFGCLIFVVLQ